LSDSIIKALQLTVVNARERGESLGELETEQDNRQWQMLDAQ
jgi:hypothetical protein